MPTWARLSCVSTQSGSLEPAKPRSNDNVVSNPFGYPASAMSCLALAMSGLNFGGSGQATSVGLSAGAPYIGLDRPKYTASMIFWYGIAQATAWRTLRLSNGGLLTFIPIYWMPVKTGWGRGCLLSPTKSLFGSS